MGAETINPLVPAGFDITWTVVMSAVAVAGLALVLAALWSVMASPRLATAGRVLWVLVVLAFPLLGPVAWFTWGRSARLDRGPA